MTDDNVKKTSIYRAAARQYIFVFRYYYNRRKNSHAEHEYINAHLNHRLGDAAGACAFNRRN